MYSATWPKQGMTRSGVAFAPPTSAAHTDASGCSYLPGAAQTSPRMLPTPQARDGDHRGAADPARRRALGHQVSLHDAVNAVVKLLPTPTAADSRSAAIQTVLRPGRPTPAGCVTLTDSVRLLPTPTASDAKASTHLGQDGGPSLSDQCRLLPTPRATDGTKGCPAQRGSKGDLMLPSAIIQLLSSSKPEGTA